MDDKLIAAISQHIEKHIGKPDRVLHELIPDEPHIDIHIVSPTAERPFYTLVTSGMSETPMNVPDEWKEHSTPYVELMLALPPDWSLDKLDEERWGWPVQWLRFLAKYPQKFNSWLWISHTVPNGEDCDPFSADTRLCCWFFRGPATVPEKFFEWPYEKGRTILFMAPTPIYREELDFAMSNEPESLVTLEEKLEAAGVTELLDLTRPVCV